MALRAGIDPGRIHMHGNNKTAVELSYAVDSGVGHVICDSLAEIERLDAICAAGGRRQEVLIRITPGVRPSTHENVQTGQLDSKFGLGLADGLAAAGIEAVLSSSSLDLVGLHAHIGSQIFELEPYVRTIEALAELADPSWCRLRERRRRPRDRLHRGRRAALGRRATPRSRSRACAACSATRRGSSSSRDARWSATRGSPRTPSAR